MKIPVCHDCGCTEGQYHDFGCDVERCPFCGQQLIGACECAYEKMGIDASPGTWAFENGLTDEQWDKWKAMCEDKGRIPYVRIPILCALCGERDPDFFRLPDAQWQRYVIPELQKEVLCRSCYDKQKLLFPHGWRKAREYAELEGVK